MRILVTGRGASGSWQIRGEQLGRAIGATVEARVTDVLKYDVAIIVKRYTEELLARLRWAKVPIVWDVVDAWPQPHGNLWSEVECKTWLRRQVHATKPIAIVAATEAMSADCSELGLPVLSLPHHARPEMLLNPIRRSVQSIGYEGAPHYLGFWRKSLERECKARGWRFVVNPGELAELDVVVALREHAGYAARRWKSNVKLANAQGSATPCIANYEAGYLETRSGAECFIESDAELGAAFDLLQGQEERRHRAATMLACAPRLESIAARYREWLSALRL